MRIGNNTITGNSDGYNITVELPVIYLDMFRGYAENPNWYL